MKRSIFATLALCACLFALAGGALSGCSDINSVSVNEEAQANRAYMSQVNESMDQLSTRLDSFVEAVSRGDVVNMRTQADDAYKALDKLSSIEAPELFADIQQGYTDGTGKLRQALDGYIALYSESSSDAFDWSTYDARMADIQALYDEGIADLEEADQKAASLEDSE